MILKDIPWPVQAIQHNCVLITKDQGFADYKKLGLQTAW
jgi:PIN domain nuclease of toxin-antitoxin system